MTQLIVGGSTGEPVAAGSIGDGADAVTLLTFTLDGRRFALPGDCVLEIVPAVAIQRLPQAPPIVEGVVNVRGVIVAVLDVRARFGIAPSPLHQDQHFIIARSGGRTVALRVDRAIDVFTVVRSAIQVPTETSGVRHVAGVAAVDDGALVIQDLEQFLALDEGAALDAALGRASAQSTR